MGWMRWQTVWVAWLPSHSRLVVASDVVDLRRTACAETTDAAAWPVCSGSLAVLSFALEKLQFIEKKNHLKKNKTNKTVGKRIFCCYKSPYMYTPYILDKAKTNCFRKSPALVEFCCEG